MAKTYESTLLARVAVLVFGLLVAGCYGKNPPRWEYRPVTGPDGTWWAAIECRETMAWCYEAAGKVCPSGYTVNDSGGTTGTETNASASRIGNVVVGQSRTQQTIHMTMMVKCKAPEAPAPVAAKPVTSIERGSPF